MIATEEFQQLFASVRLNAPASKEALAKFEAEAGKRLPTQYREFLLAANGGEGPFGRAYLRLMPAEQLVSWRNELQLNNAAPELLLIGNDGATDSFGYDDNQSEAIFVIPLGDWDTRIRRGNDLWEFLRNIYWQGIL